MKMKQLGLFFYRKSTTSNSRLKLRQPTHQPQRLWLLIPSGTQREKAHPSGEKGQQVLWAEEAQQLRGEKVPRLPETTRGWDCDAGQSAGEGQRQSQGPAGHAPRGGRLAAGHADAEADGAPAVGARPTQHALFLVRHAWRPHIGVDQFTKESLLFVCLFRPPFFIINHPLIRNKKRNSILSSSAP